MKHDVLRSVAHNIADSLASGLGLPIGLHGTDIFEEARRSQTGCVTVDFLNGTAIAGTPSLTKALVLYRDVLSDLCKKQNVLITDFRKLTACYSVSTKGRKVIVEIEDKNGRSSTDQYVDSPLRHIRVTDGLGRVRCKRHH